MIEVKDLYVRAGGREILSNISFSFCKNGIYFVLGANGSGKSTLLQAVMNLIPFEGEVRIFGQDVRKLSRRELAKLVGYVWQNPFHGFFEASVEREIQFILRNTGYLNNNNIKAMIEHFDIQRYLKRSPFTLSGGEAKRVSLASVLVADQPILLLDEPESEMDIKGIEKLIEYLIQNEKRKIIIIATYNTILAYKLKSHIKGIILLNSGHLKGLYDTNILHNYDLLEDAGLVSLRWLNEFA